MCSVSGGGRDVASAMSAPSIPPLYRVLLDLRCRKLLSGRKMGPPSPFSIMGVRGRGATSLPVALGL